MGHYHGCPYLFALENTVGSFATVDVSGDIPAGKICKVHMRHGQNTALTLEMLKVVEGIEQHGQLGRFQQYMGDAVQGEGLPLCSERGLFFFNKTMEAPAQLTTDDIYMAILVGGCIVPDKRVEPNPANVPLPPAAGPARRAARRSLLSYRTER
jgi:hypothetical protein